LVLAGFTTEAAASRASGELGALALRAVSDGFDRVVVCGGDGSIREAAQGLRDTAMPLGIVPLGTVNILAREMGLPVANPLACSAIASRGRVQAIGLGSVNGTEAFTFCASVGLDALAVDAVDLAMKRQTGAWAYAYAGMLSFIQEPLPELRVEISDGGRFTASQIFAVRAKRYGGELLHLSKRADLRAGTMRLIMVAPPLGRYLPALLWRLAASDLEGAPGVIALDTHSFTVEADRPWPVQADGDIVGRTPARITSRASALYLVFPDGRDFP
jgi:diacylglycerol kinase (ATP)